MGTKSKCGASSSRAVAAATIRTAREDRTRGKISLGRGLGICSGTPEFASSVSRTHVRQACVGAGGGRRLRRGRVVARHAFPAPCPPTCPDTVSALADGELFGPRCVRLTARRAGHQAATTDQGIRCFDQLPRQRSVESPPSSRARVSRTVARTRAVDGAWAWSVRTRSRRLCHRRHHAMPHAAAPRP